MKHMLKFLKSVKITLMLLLAFTIVASTTVYAANILVLYAESGNVEKDNFNYDVLDGHFNDLNSLEIEGKHVDFDRFDSLQDAYDRIAHYQDCNHYDYIFIVGDGVDADTILLNGEEVSTTDFDSGLITDVLHCYKDDDETTWYEKDILNELSKYINE